MNYEETIKHTSDFTVPNLIKLCRSLLPPQYERCPYSHPELRNGTAILQSEDGMNCYIAAYGEMHMAKCRGALQNFPFDRIDDYVELVDWGCGQGIGSLCTVEAFKQHRKEYLIKQITLIEPSKYTLRRAIINVKKITAGNVTIIPINQYMPSVKHEVGQEYLESLSYRYHYVIHIFSNILDLACLDLSKLARMVSVSGHQHIIMCMGPVNTNSYRIDQFCSVFGAQDIFSKINDKSYGRTSDTYYTYTCKTECFVYNGQSLDFSKMEHYNQMPISYSESEYDPQMAVKNGSISQAICDIYKMFSPLLNENDLLLIKPDVNGDKPDLMIVKPHTGILIINVFDDDINNYKHVDYKDNKSIIINNIGQKIMSPIAKIETYWDNFIRLHIDGLMEMAVQDSKCWGIVKRMVYFAKNSAQEANDFFNSRDTHTNIIGKDILNDISQQKCLLHRIHFDGYNNVFDDTAMRGLMRIISPGWHSYKEGKAFNLTSTQKTLVKSEAYKRQKISGAAGSGKTQVLATRAVNAQVRTGGDVLILTYNIALANYMRYRMNDVRADFTWDKLHITYYHRFFRSMAYRAGLHVSFGAYENINFFKGYESRLTKYDAIFIDEVQDYNSEWLQILNDNFLKPDGEFVVFGDPKQNVYGRPLDSLGDIRLGVISGLWNHSLKDGMRFTNPQLASLAYEFQKEFLGKDHVDGIEKNPVQTDLTTCIKYADIGLIKDDKQTKTLARYCRNILKDFHVSSSTTVVLSQMGDILRLVDYYYRQLTGNETSTTFVKKEVFDELLKKHLILSSCSSIANYGLKRDKDSIEHGLKERFTMDTRFLKMSTIHSFKGWESPTVILIIESEDASSPIYRVPSNLDKPEIIYTAITRARENLFIFNLGNKKYDEFFKKHIK